MNQTASKRRQAIATFVRAWTSKGPEPSGAPKVRQAGLSLSVLRTSGVVLGGVPRPDGRGYFLLALRASIGDDLSTRFTSKTDTRRSFLPEEARLNDTLRREQRRGSEAGKLAVGRPVDRNPLGFRIRFLLSPTRLNGAHRPG
jgi:hypothetical protein